MGRADNLMEKWDESEVCVFSLYKQTQSRRV